MENLKQKFALFFTSEPMKTFRKENIVDVDKLLKCTWI